MNLAMGLAEFDVAILERRAAQALADWRNQERQPTAWSDAEYLYERLRDSFLAEGRVHGLVEAVALLKDEHKLDTKDRVWRSVAYCTVCDKDFPTPHRHHAIPLSGV